MELSRAERKALTRERILDAGLVLLEQGRGLDSLGLRELAREAGLAATSLYNHFANMDELGLALVERACYRLRSRMGEGRRALIEGDAEQAISAMIEKFLAYLDEHETEFRLLVRQRLGHSPVYRRRIHRELHMLVEELAEDVRVAVSRRLDLPVEVLREAEAAVAVMFGFGILALDVPSSQRRRRLPDLQVQLRMVFLGGRALAAGASLD